MIHDMVDSLFLGAMNIIQMSEWLRILDKDLSFKKVELR